MSTYPNGEELPKIEVGVISSDDRVLFRCKSSEPNVPYALSMAVEDWCLKNPDCKVRTALGFVANGRTVAIRMWFDQLPKPTKISKRARKRK
jgi:hypothetical protein